MSRIAELGAFGSLLFVHFLIIERQAAAAGSLEMGDTTGKKHIGDNNEKTRNGFLEIVNVLHKLSMQFHDDPGSME